MNCLYFDILEQHFLLFHYKLHVLLKQKHQLETKLQVETLLLDNMSTVFETLAIESKYLDKVLKLFQLIKLYLK